MKITSQGLQTQTEGSVLPLDRSSPSSESLRRVVKAAFLGFLAAGQSSSLATPAASSTLQLALPVMTLQMFPYAYAQSQMVEMNLGETATYPELIPSESFQVSAIGKKELYPQITAFRGGGTAIAWIQIDPVSSQSSIHVRFVNANGKKYGKEAQFETDTLLSEEGILLGAIEGGMPLGIGAKEDGSCTVTWIGKTKEGNYDLYAQDFDPSIGLSGPLRTAKSPSTNPPTFPQIAHLANGGSVLAWLGYPQERSSPLPVRQFQVFDAQGEKVGEEISTTKPSHELKIISLSSGGFILYSEEIPNLSGSDSNASLYNSSGEKVTELDFSKFDENVGVAPLKGIGFIAVGPHFISEEEGFKLLIQIYDPSGNILEEHLASTNLLYSDPEQVVDLTAKVIFLKDGSFIVLGFKGDDKDGAVYGERFSPGGEQIGDTFSILEMPGNFFPEIVATDEGGCALTWEQTDRGIFAKLFTTHDILPSNSTTTTITSTSSIEQPTSITNRESTRGSISSTTVENAPSVDVNRAGRACSNPFASGSRLLERVWSQLFS